jgi:hypothetical protein
MTEAELQTDMLNDVPRETLENAKPVNPPTKAAPAIIQSKMKIPKQRLRNTDDNRMGETAFRERLHTCTVSKTNDMK